MKKLFLLFLVICGFLSLANGQQKTITGTITGSEDNLPVAGVTVLVKGTTTGVLSDINGKYQIVAPAGSTIEFRYVGMKTKEVVVGPSNVYDISLELEQIGLDEIVVVGYGTQIKSKVSSSITKVSGENLRNSPVTSVELALQGKSAGVFIE
jgi:TonB-dependent starch-binding outer membrane protein SusC